MCSLKVRHCLVATFSSEQMAANRLHEERGPVARHVRVKQGTNRIFRENEEHTTQRGCPANSPNGEKVVARDQQNQKETGEIGHLRVVGNRERPPRKRGVQKSDGSDHYQAFVGGRIPGQRG